MDEDARRKYWTEQLDQGYEMIEQLLEYPVEECGEPFASLQDAAEDAGVEIQFSDSKINGVFDRIYSMRESNVRDVIRIAHEMNERGWILKIEDAFRTLEMQRSLVRKKEVFDSVVEKCRWEVGGDIPSLDLVVKRSIVMVANIPKVGGHMSGSAIDISVYRREDGSEISRGGSYLTVNETTPMRSPFIPDQDLKNRLEITRVMKSHGFMHFPFEFWHYSKGDATDRLVSGTGLPAKFGAVNWDSQTDETSPVADPFLPLNPLPDMEKEIEAALGRLSQQ